MQVLLDVVKGAGETLVSGNYPGRALSMCVDKKLVLEALDAAGSCRAGQGRAPLEPGE